MSQPDDKGNGENDVAKTKTFSHGIVWLPDHASAIHHYDSDGQSVGLCDCGGEKVTVEVNPRDFNTADVVHAPPGFEARAAEFWKSPSYFGTTFFETQREEILSNHLATAHHCQCEELTAELQVMQAIKNGALDSPPDTQQSKDLGGDCIRCHVHTPGVKLFLLKSNPSYKWSADPLAQMMPEVTQYMVCKNCLSDEEIARLLIPVAVFVLEALLVRVPSGVFTQEAFRIRAILAQQHGGYDTLFHQARKKALEALG